MANAILDKNNVPVMIGLLNTDGATVINIAAKPTTMTLDIDDNTTGSDHGGNPAKRDANSKPILMAVSNSNGTTPVALYVDATGHLLVNSN